MTSPRSPPIQQTPIVHVVESHGVFAPGPRPSSKHPDEDETADETEKMLTPLRFAARFDRLAVFTTLLAYLKDQHVEISVDLCNDTLLRDVVRNVVSPGCRTWKTDLARRFTAACVSLPLSPDTFELLKTALSAHQTHSLWLWPLKSLLATRRQLKWEESPGLKWEDDNTVAVILEAAVYTGLGGDDAAWEILQECVVVEQTRVPICIEAAIQAGAVVSKDHLLTAGRYGLLGGLTTLVQHHRVSPVLQQSILDDAALRMECCNLGDHSTRIHHGITCDGCGVCPILGKCHQWG